MKQHQVSVIYLDCGNSQGGGLHCMTSEIRKSGWIDSPHLIPINSQTFPAHISTKLQLKNCYSAGIVLNIMDPVAKSTTEIGVPFNPNDSSVEFEIQVPLDRNLEYFLSGTKTTIDGQKRCILPGQPQVFYAAPVSSKIANATWIKGFQS
jgi:hypothetical protein